MPIKKQHIFNIDLKDFFPSITFRRVKGVFSNEPFNFPNNVAVVLARICTHEGVLPQGSPTSPPLSNYICRGLDGQLQELARKNFATYSRYADDLTFSFSRKHRESLPNAIVQFQETTAVVGSELEWVIQQHGFSINVSKTRLCFRTSRMEVTGLTVNEFPNVKRKYVDEIRGMLNAWDKHGLEKAQAVFEQKTYKRQLRNEHRSRFEHVLRGKLTYLHMVKGSDDRVHNSLAQRFNSCIQKYEITNVKRVPIADIVFAEKDLDRAVFLLSALDEKNDFEIKSTAFFLKDVGIVTCEHSLRYPTTVEAALKTLALHQSSTVDFLVRVKLLSTYKILKNPILVDLR
jgi:RNA-directed DNA polymerase